MLPDPPSISPTQATLARLRRMAAISFLANSARREARRKRWAGQDKQESPSGIIADYLAGKHTRAIAKEHGVSWRYVTDLAKGLSEKQHLTHWRKVRLAQYHRTKKLVGARELQTV